LGFSGGGTQGICSTLSISDGRKIRQVAGSIPIMSCGISGVAHGISGLSVLGIELK